MVAPESRICLSSILIGVPVLPKTLYDVTRSIGGDPSPDWHAETFSGLS